MSTIVVITGADPVVNGANFQDALDDSTFGDVIVLEEGVDFYGNFVLRYKGAGTGTDADYITIQTSNISGITEAGTRIMPSNGGAMPRLIANSDVPALEAEADSHHYKFVGIQITSVGGSTVTNELVLLGGRSSGGGIPFAQHPHHITFDRCWIREATNDTTTPDSYVTTSVHGLAIDATDITIKECRIAGFRTYKPTPAGVEATMAIFFPSSSLRVSVTNNYIEAWFVPIFFGGAGGETPNNATLSSVSFDIESHTGSAIFTSTSNLAVGDLVAFKVTGGHCPPTNSSHPSEAVQFQVGKVTDISGSTVTYMSWGTFDGDLTGGNPLLQAPDAPGLAQWNGYVCQDITIERNDIILNFTSTEAVWVLTGGSPTTEPRYTQTNTGNAPKGVIEIKMARNVLINGNTFDGWGSGMVVTTRNQGSTLTSGGFPWAGVFNVTVSNNWWKKTINWDRIYGFPIGGPQLEDNEYSSTRGGPFVFSNNLVEFGTGPILASMAGADDVTVVHNTYPGTDIPPGASMVLGQGTDSPNFTFKDNILTNNEYGMNCQAPIACWPGLDQSNNIIIDNRTPGTQIGDGPLNSRYPNDFIVATQDDVGWIDAAGHNYVLAADSPYKAMASDDTDPGIDMAALSAALGGFDIDQAVRSSRGAMFLI